MKPQELMTAKQVRTYVGCAPNTLTKAVREGRFPAPALILGCPQGPGRGAPQRVTVH